MQQSEGGGLGVGGSPAGLMSARGAASFMTRATAFLAITFVVLSITLAAIAASNNTAPKVDTSLQPVNAPASAPLQPAPSPAANPDPIDAPAKQ